MESERQKKILLMKVCVVSVIILIIVLWIFNIKNVWRPVNVNKSQDQTASLEFTKFKDDINKQMTEINQRLSIISNQKQDSQNQAGNELLNNIIKDTEKASSTISTSTKTNVNSSSSSVPIVIPETPSLKKNNCPPYINCMPSIGAARSCKIPAGCEGVTQIAY